MNVLGIALGTGAGAKSVKPCNNTSCPCIAIQHGFAVGGISPGSVGSDLNRRRELHVFREDHSGYVTVSSFIRRNRDSVRGQNHQIAVIAPSEVHCPSGRVNL
jgi:hypothetical protein